MSRFIIIDQDEAKKYDNAEEFIWESAWEDDYKSYLADTKENRLVYADGGEPEDQTLGRDLGFFVDLLNEVADGPR